MVRNMSIKICIIGAGGRMGKNIATVVYNDKDCEVYAAIDKSDSEAINQNVYEYAGCGKGGVLIADDINMAKGADVIIDFTGSKVTMANLDYYKSLGIALVVGSTGFTPEEKSSLIALSKDIPLLLAPNMSLGVNVMFKLAALAAKSLKGYDIEIVETHHKMKKDAPSGTAMGIAEAVAKAINIDLEKDAVYARHGIIGERKDGEIGIQTLRGGDVVGDHTLYFFGNGERIEITHRATSRATFAEGAVTAAKWLSGKSNGFYTMEDVLF